MPLVIPTPLPTPKLTAKSYHNIFKCSAKYELLEILICLQHNHIKYRRIH